MNRNTKSEMNIHLVPEKVRFSLFTAEEIKNMSVTKIVTPLMLDALGHPLPGGLYDSKLGPLSDRSEPCGTCKKTMSNCPGHFGYIDLPLPVVNPIFNYIIGALIRISCLRCYHIQIPTHMKRCLTIQIKLLNSGLITAAMEVGTKIGDLIAKYQKYENIPEEELGQVIKYEQLASDTFEKLGRKAVLSQNVETIRNQLINQMIKSVSALKRCLFCKQPMEKKQVLKNRVILSSRKSAGGHNTSGTSQQVIGMEAKYVNPEESRQYMRKIWTAEKDIVLQLVSVLADIKLEYPTDAFYFEVIPVPPINLRPLNIVMDRVLENRQSQIYKLIVQNVILLRTIIQMAQQKGDQDILASTEAKEAYNITRGETAIEKLNFVWEELQQNINALVDNEAMNMKESEGLKQIIEKKQGIVRMNMMGKRVNFSARSVITPDPNLNIDEIGVPEEFAKRLTYPVPVTPWNVEELRKMILNGPNVHPGAVMVEYNGTVKRINPNSKIQQKGILKCLLTPDDKDKGLQTVKIVHRHLCNGDVLLLNRQPTLHKPSIMAHTARILKGEKTLRLHYANCKAYNADFDGDEMNAHFPQNELARSEGYNIVNVSNQYLVPKDGTPLSGLIQDHMIAGVRLSLRGRFFTKDDYQQLVYQALSFKTSRITLLPPAILKPARLWSGKQILSTVLINIIPTGKIPINLTASAKIPAKAWQSVTPRRWKAGGSPFFNPNTMSEAEVIIRHGELLVGILDKTHYGATPYGLIHCMYELYGGTYATRLLSSFAKLFMRFLQQEGFTLGVHDILTVRKADLKRKNIIKESRKIGADVITSALNLPKDTPLEQIVENVEETVAADPKIRAVIDRHYKSALDSYTNEINRACLPAGLLCKFPQNNLQLMVQSGAKGSTVNTMQISCLLGQIELEGKRPPVMISGKSLPSFPIFEFTPRAGGFIDGRFMTGIQPQEFFFHCMAGREGLIDTAVKTSRSGYLQRCLIKHLEGLHVAYDMTVRNSDNSVVQFLYGEDGLDVSKAQFLNEKQLPFLSENTKALAQEDVLRQLKSSEEAALVKNHQSTINGWKGKFGIDPLDKIRRSPFAIFSNYVKGKVGGLQFKKKKIIKMWCNLDKEVKESFKQYCERCPDPISSTFQPDANFGSINERLAELINTFAGPKKKKFGNMMKLKIMQSMCSPGEPVGLLAAQSIGEPSTQMTLNTFHFAGRGEMNVTLGIPRLREILMMASKNIKTPSMEIPFLNVPNLEDKADTLRKLLARVTVADVLEKIDVTTEIELTPVRQHRYTVKVHVLPKRYYEEDYCVTPKQILDFIERRYFKEMFNLVRKYSKISSRIVMMDEGKSKRKPGRGGNVEDEEEAEVEVQDKNGAGQEDEQNSSEDEIEDEEDAKTTSKFKQTREDQEKEEEDEASEDSDSDVEGDTNNEPDDIKPKVDDETQSELDKVLTQYKYAKDYTKDGKKYQWCQITFALPLNFEKFDLTAILKEAAVKCVIWQTPNIKRAITYVKEDKLMLRTDGINIVEMFKYHDILDLEKLYCNDIHKVSETYGIEAAARIIVKEVKDVFNVYGIKVDPRHLSLIADYMTFNGTFEPLSRKGMESSASPMQQISFEASLGFLKNAVIRGKEDDLQNPSSSLMIGKPCSTGTGCFSLIHQFPSSKVAN